MESLNDFANAAAGWMQDFFTGIYGWALAMNLPISATAQAKSEPPKVDRWMKGLGMRNSRSSSV